MASAGTRRSLDPLVVAVEELRAGRPVVVVDDEDRENEGDLVMAAQFATARTMGFFVRFTSGLICVPMAGEIADRLRLPLMVEPAPGTDPAGTTASTVSVDAVGTGSGISAADRAATARTPADASARPGQLVRPGHMFPLRARPGGVAERRGRTEATVDLLLLAGLAPVGVLGEVCEDDGSLARFERLRAFADEHRPALVSIEQLSRHLRAAGMPVLAVPRDRRELPADIVHLPLDRAPDAARALPLLTRLLTRRPGPAVPGRAVGTAGAHRPRRPSGVSRPR
ncbi:3,4-dihydroxy-2-butanone-4-phosphate synthase [Streptomyces sp. NPDC058751]|uniref:3,4-dihydroxy-2-butanone-4-phosphate synthase n=1 Tax=Streptomyces sp. NPDC058751 TaxID=3346623 RepID=UPI0036763D62